MKNRKSIIALLLVAVIGVVGLTLAYFTNTANIQNEFKTNSYGTTVEEEFVSPTNWTPGTTTNKTLVVTNSGNVDEAARVEIIESWTSKNGDPLPLKQNGNDAAIINWANTDDWTKAVENNKTYYYYNYKLAPTEVTSTLLDSVTFNPLITNDSNCQTTESNGVKTITCNSTGDGYDGATYTLTFKVETVQYDKYQTAWGTNVEVLAEKPLPTPSGAEYLANNATNAANAEYNAQTKGNMFTFTHGEGANAVTETRYIGDAPNNYVKFNCDNDGTNCETWRILGVFDVDDGTGNVEQRIKLVRGNAFADQMYWNENGDNDWTISVLKTFLNGDYYNRINDAATYGLKASAKSMIDNAVFYLGAGPESYDDGNGNSTYGTTEEIYAWERGTETCVTTGSCEGERPTQWTGKVALMYPSDEYMAYGKGVDTTCYNNPYNCDTSDPTTGWVYNSNIKEGEESPDYIWLFSSVSGDSSFAFNADSAGDLSDHGVDSYSSAVRPVVYLKSNIKITEGTGESGSPFKLGL